MFNLKKYDFVKKEMINWFSEMYVYFAIDKNIMSNELYDMYNHVAKYILDNPNEMDELIFSILDEHNLLPKNKVEQQQNIIENLENEIKVLKGNQQIQNEAIAEMAELTNKLLEQGVIVND